MSGWIPAIVNGGVVLTGPATDGTDSQVLVTDGEGRLRFETAQVALSGLLPIDRGGTGGGTAPEALSNLGGEASGTATAVMAAHVAVENPHSQYALHSTLSSKADLVSGKIPTSQLPALAISEFLGRVDDETEMLALAGERGDYCYRTDLQAAVWLTTDDPTNVDNWLQVALPTVSVLSVNNQTGAVVLGPADVGAAAAVHGHAISDVTYLPSALDGKANASHAHSQSDVTHLVSDLAGKAPVIHTHVPGDVTGLESALSGKAPFDHSHALSDVTGLQTALHSKVDSSQFVLRDMALSEALEKTFHTRHGFAHDFVSTSMINAASVGHDTSESGVVKPWWPATTGSSSCTRAQTHVAREVQLIAGQQLTGMWVHCVGIENELILKVAQQDSTSKFDVQDVTGTVNHPGGGWAYFALSSPFTVPSTGTWRLAVYIPGTGSVTSLPAIPFSYKSGNITGDDQTGFGTWTGTFPLRPVYGTDMELRLNEKSISDEPATIDVHLLVDEVDSLALNTDVAVFASRDGGATWEPGELERLGTAGSLKLWRAGGMDVSEQPAGSSLSLRIITDNGKVCKIHAVSVLGQ